MKIEKSSQDLENEVIYAGLCIHCGSCIALSFRKAREMPFARIWISIKAQVKRMWWMNVLRL